MDNLEILLLILAIFGGFDLASRGVQTILNIFPFLLKSQSKGWKYVSEFSNINYLRRKAISSRTEEVLNITAHHLQSFLPNTWIKRARVKWVRNPQKYDFNDNMIVLRIRPEINQDSNLMQSLWMYFYGILFPDTRDVIPDKIISAIALAVARAGIEKEFPHLLTEFDKNYVLSIANKEENLQIGNNFADYVRLNDIGFLMGPFIREVDSLAKQIRFSSNKNEVSTAIGSITKHMLTFQPLMRSNMPEENWNYKNDHISYGLILVSKPPEIRPNIDAYIQRVKLKIENGIQNIYILGRHDERDFVNDVIKEVLRIRELKGIEFFTLFKDYRCDLGGYAALLGPDPLLKKLNLSLHQTTLYDSSLSEEINMQKIEQDNILELAEIINDIIEQLSDYDKAWVRLADVGNNLRMKIPKFAPKNYGSKNLLSLLKRIDRLEFNEDKIEGKASVYYVRCKT